MRIYDGTSSALSAFSVDMMVRANNIANVNTSDFKAQTVSLTSGPEDQGVAVGRIGRDMAAGAVIPGGATGDVQASNTDIAREYVHMVGTQTAYKANATLMRSYDDMAGSLLDMMA